jgi:nucleoside 2-deoxyribosyltransferase
MMKFGKTPAHKKIVTAIRSALKEHGISALRADDKKYHPQLYPNIQTYMHGCGFGIAVIERLESNDFNPNVSLEVGYLLALRKPVCLLKDQTLPSLQSDLLGHLYEPFDPQNPSKSIPPLLRAWLSDSELV